VIATGCGGGGSSSTTASTTTGPKETAQKLPKLPPGWKTASQRRSVLFRSPDHLVAVTLAANRDPAVFETSPEKFAAQALGGLPGFKVPLNPGKVMPFKGTPLKALQTSATGSQAGGIKESATLVVLRRDDLVNYTVAVLANAQQPGANVDRAVALRVIQTLRDQPVKGSGTGKG
jgi:hypothetical protein